MLKVKKKIQNTKNKSQDEDLTQLQNVIKKRKKQLMNIQNFLQKLEMNMRNYKKKIIS